MQNRQKMDLINQQYCLVKTLKKIRLDAGLRQTDLSKKLGRPQSYVSKYETGARQLSFLEIRAICMETNISLIDFAKLFELFIENGGKNNETE